MSQNFVINDSIYPSRGEWSEYSIFYDRQIPKTSRIILREWQLPEYKVGESTVSELAIVVNSNLGVIGSTERGDTLGGPGVKLFSFLKDAEGKWVIRGGNPSLEYPSYSTTYKFRLRYRDPLSRQYRNFPTSPKLKWSLNLALV